MDRFKAQAEQFYNQIITLGGRPTRPIQKHPNEKPYMVDGMTHYREDYERIEVICEVDDRRASSHWAKERNYWGDELWRWQKFKEGQQIHGRSELDLELKNTDEALTEALSKLDDWQQFQLHHQRKVSEAEMFYEECQQNIAKSLSAMDAVSSVDRMFAVQKPFGGWLSKAQEQLDASQKDLMWVKSQWTEVIAEACASIAPVPRLQKELEAKFEMQTKTVYRTLQEKGARPSHSIHPPDKKATFAQRLQHWISEDSGFEAELWDWKLFTAWRRCATSADTANREAQKQPSSVDPYSDPFEDLVKYHQHEYHKAVSWVNC